MLQYISKIRFIHPKPLLDWSRYCIDTVPFRHVYPKIWISRAACRCGSDQGRRIKETRRLKSVSSDFTANKHVIASCFQLAQDTAPDVCALQNLHHRVPPRYLMYRRTETNLIGSVEKHRAAWPTRESICRTDHFKQTWDLLIWAFWWDKCCRGLRPTGLFRFLIFALCAFNNLGWHKETACSSCFERSLMRIHQKDDYRSCDENPTCVLWSSVWLKWS